MEIATSSPTPTTDKVGRSEGGIELVTPMITDTRLSTHGVVIGRFDLI